MSSFEAVMPMLGLLIGRGLGAAIGGVADYIAAGFLGALGLYLLLGDEGGEHAKVDSLSTRRGLALLGLGVSISLDELAMGFSIGLLHLSIWLAVTLIGVQAFAVAQIGLRLGARLGEVARAWAERLAAVALLALGILILGERLTA
jgi:putative Mn2+ efflux pump MntP